eukprot:gene2897-3602_t
MVLITRYLPIITESNKPTIEANNTKEQIIDSILHNTTVGLINQLMVLADHANSIFTTLTNESTLVCNRLNKLNGRISPLIQMVSNVEMYHQNNSIETLNSKPRAEYHADNAERHQHFNHSSIPQAVEAVYTHKCKAPPNLQLLDPYMDEGQKALKLYTNPDFFIDEWVAEQNKLREEARQRRRERKEARLRKKSEKGETSEVKKVKRVHKVRYDPVTGEKILIPVDSPATPTGNTPIPQPQYNNNLSSSQQHQTPNHIPPPPPTSSYHHPPPPSISTSNGSLPPPPPTSLNSSYNQAAQIPPPPSTSAPYISTPPPPPTSGYGTLNRQSLAVPLGAPPPPPPPSAPAPPPPPPPAAFVPKSGLAQALEAGGSNLKAAEIKPKASDARSDLLTSIMAGISLKPAEERKIAEAAPVKKEEALNVADILARRIAWAASDSEDDDDSDDDSDWD